MYSERMQILLSPSQRRRLEAEAKRRGMSVAAVVREAIDARVETVPPDRRRAAMERLRGRHVPFVPLRKLEALIDEGRDVVPGRAR
jgi:predicted DNA-binding protein